MFEPALSINALQGWRGSAHVLQDLTMEFTTGRLAVVGRNGMGKTTLCEAVTGVLAATPRSRISGQVRIYGVDVTRQAAHRTARLGVGYVPQGRRPFPSLTVEENLKVALHRGKWTIERVYELFPRLAERRRLPSTALSGGEQQMLAIGRALVTQPRLLIMDEPSEGLAPVIVERLVDACLVLADEGMDILVVEQNLAVAVAMAPELLVVTNGHITARLDSQHLLEDSELQHRHLGISRHETMKGPEHRESPASHAPTAKGVL